MAPALIAGDAAARAHAIEVSVAAKAAIVAEDERETGGQRALLNLGHTFAHALEAETGFSDLLLHGEAVALGMALAFRFSAERGLVQPAEDAERVADHLRAVGLPTTLGPIPATGEALVAHMRTTRRRAAAASPSSWCAASARRSSTRRSISADVAAFLDRQRA